VEQRRRIFALSYTESYARRDFLDANLDGTGVFALADGTHGIPMFVDPLVMYWNKDSLTNAGFLSPPRTWEELVNVQLPALIQRTFDRSITRGVVAMGVYENTEHAYGLLSALLLQGGSPMVTERMSSISGSNQLVYQVALDESVSGSDKPFTNGLRFYVGFGQPSNTLYSWNRSFTSDRSEFISEDLVFYFGFTSEARELERLNPNFNFDIAEIPQGANATVRRTYGKHYALSPLSASDNLAGALTVMARLSSEDVMQQLADAYQMVPAKRSLAGNGSDDVYGRIAYRAAPVAYGWLNPNRTAVDDILADAVSDVNENRNDVPGAVRVAVNKLIQLYD
jgi:hypothetical protein